MRKNNQITVILDEADAKKFEEISAQTNWQDKFIVAISLRHYYNEFSKDWEKAVIGALKGNKNEPNTTVKKR